MGKGNSVAIAVAFLGAAVIAALWKFNYWAASYNLYVVGNLIGLMFLPMLLTTVIFRIEPSEFGLGLGSSKRVWVFAGLAFAVMVPALLIVSRWPAFQSYYPLYRWYPEFASAFAGYPRTNPFDQAPWLMVYAELSYGVYLFWWEYFFRGFLLFGLWRSIGWWAILAQTVGFTLLHYGKPAPEVVASFGAAIILGIMASKAKSFIPCFVLHWAVSITLDFLAVASRTHVG